MPKVYIEKSNADYDSMFENRGWELVDSIEQANMLQLTGGEDVSPILYGEAYHPQTRDNPHRDLREIYLINKAWELNIPVAGICRGAQFLNVTCGGKLWQHVDGHAIGGTHVVYRLNDRVGFAVTSTHHQMMIPGPNAEILLTANISTRLEGGEGHINEVGIEDHVDIECVYYPQMKALCYQPHPEYLERMSHCQIFYFARIFEMFGLR